MFYKLAPEVAGHLGPETIIDRSQRPQLVRAVHYEFDGWPEDDLIESFPCFLVTVAMQGRIEAAKASGCSFGPTKITVSEQFEELEEFHEPRTLPAFQWMIVHGTPGRDDLGLSADGSLIVSERVLRVLKAGRLDHCDVVAV